MIPATGRRSFTFIELIFVVLILGIIVAVSVPAFRHNISNLELDGATRSLQAFMNYLREYSIVQRRIVALTVDNENKEYWSYYKDETARIKTFTFSQNINIESGQEEIFFYPDGSIDKVTLSLINKEGDSTVLTTKGVFKGVKVQPRQ